MADAGYDVYIGSNRGTEYSSGHKSLAYDSQEYWDYTLDAYAEDVLASMKAVYDHSGFKKGTYVGYSMGTLQMLLALTKFESVLEQYINKAILLAPCMFMNDA